MVQVIRQSRARSGRGFRQAPGLLKQEFLVDAITRISDFVPLIVFAVVFFIGPVVGSGVFVWWLWRRSLPERDEGRNEAGRARDGVQQHRRRPAA